MRVAWYPRTKCLRFHPTREQSSYQQLGQGHPRQFLPGSEGGYSPSWRHTITIDQKLIGSGKKWETTAGLSEASATMVSSVYGALGSFKPGTHDTWYATLPSQSIIFMRFCPTPITSVAKQACTPGATESDLFICCWERLLGLLQHLPSFMMVMHRQHDGMFGNSQLLYKLRTLL